MRLLRVLVLLVLFILPFGAKSQLNTERMMMIGRNALYFEDYVLSIRYFNMVIGSRPRLSEPYFFRGLAKYNLDDMKGAADDLSKSIERNPYVPKYYQLRGLCHVKMEQYDSAEYDFKRAIYYEPQNVGIWNNLILTTIHREKWDEAEAMLDSMLLFAPRSANISLMRMQVSMEKKDTASARRWVDEAISLDKYSSSVYQARAMLLAKMEQYDSAEVDMDRAIELMPNRSDHYINRALVRYYRENLRGAMDDYDMALNADPKSFLGHYNRGLLRAQVGDDNRAIEDFDMVLSVDADNMLARFNRAILRDRTGDLQGAIDDYSKVIEEYPNFEYGYQCRAKARRKMGDSKGAADDETWLLKRQIEQYNNARNGAKAANDTLNSSEKTRKKSDRNVRNYNKVVVADADGEKEYLNTYRGKVQNRKVDVRLLPMYAMTYYERPHDVGETLIYYKPLSDVETKKLLPYRLLLTNNERSLSESEVQRHFDNVNIHSKMIADSENKFPGYMARSLDYYLVQDFASALNDLTDAIAIGGDELWMAYFMRASVRYKMIESEALNGSSNNDAVPWESYSGDKLPNFDYQLVKGDLSQVITLMPDFPQAYYNRGNVYAFLNDFKSAVVDYTEAIKLNEGFAEAYYNRGLAQIYLGKTTDGIADLSKAGELGLYSAYNIIKRFKDK